MGRKKRHPEVVKKEAVALLFEGYRTEIVARKLNVHPQTIRLWLKQYEDEVDEVMARRRTEEERMREASIKLPELEKKYKKAIKLLGEKELELEILRELVKKKASRLETAQKWIDRGHPVRKVLRICGVPSSTYYYRLKHPVKRHSGGRGRPIPGYSKDRDGKVVSDSRIKGYLRHLIKGEHSASGYRKLTALLRRKYKLVINKKKVYRLCKELGILSPQRKIASPVPKKLAKNRIVTAPNQLWQMDIKYGYVVGNRRHFMVANIIDVFDRQIV